ncbi:MAG: chromosomal replication initiator protein DnaA [Candidatus Zambryskibacteria bacterium CG11_big_fil_rev_8_21_14_0_20_42_18]|uniref:Chromosomal replication initiator protein DnaA n=1 Tax=Candidatus Zambryskibacteria bacterium CG_4_9_14_3_um_filter_42_15 TaxID=1975112 RepID=A0A2M7WSK2_9BACT|nr:MAG: chromosomal replication initiator protein DnaA [Candidatus Zambryskibacteria bacterium CG11_big_fil_rev_8_21_14_0_20_42_18]PJA32978.1 MAG: chromosomal replication initiator protein DnaA [Candidatus Zambryskibacteria bacterium CG_4_9_14_3_um_filter_42_15]
MINYKQLWESVLVEIELSISSANFTTWFKDIRVVKEDSGVIILSVPNAFVKEWLLTKYHNMILKSLRGLESSIHAIEYVVNKEESHKKEEKIDQESNTKELPLEETRVNKDDNLNPRYTFETFIIGPFNELAHAAAQAVIKKPGVMYNPLFIHGSTGHGKTHLIQAIGNHIKKTDPSKRVYYMTSEQFGQDCMNALQNQKMTSFKEKYRKYDVLIVDDVQFFSDKQKFQEELFHLFNTLYDNNRQIIFSSDKHPYFITGLEDRLKSRLSAGMTVDIPAPDKESRMAIISAKASRQGISLSPEIIDYLAHTVNGNIRDLEGAVNTVFCNAQLKNKEVSMIDVRDYIKNNVKPKKTMAVKDVVRIISDFYSVKEDSIYEKTRHKEVIRPRQIVMYILREDFNISYPSIGQKLGGRDHTTVIHSCEKVKNDIKVDPSLLEEIGQIRNLLSV